MTLRTEVVKIPDELNERIIAWAHNVLESRGRGDNPVSRAREVPGVMGLQQWWWGKAGECAAAILLGLDPVTSLNWSVIPDGQGDLIYQNVDVDVKTSVSPKARNMIWPVTKRHMLRPGSMAEILVYSRAFCNLHVEVCSWIKASLFRANYKVADTEGRVGAPRIAGTPYMAWDDESGGMRDIHELKATLDKEARVGAR